MALSGSFQKKPLSWLTFKTEWTAKQDIAANQSTITCKHSLIVASNGSIYIGSRSDSCTVGGVKKTFTAPAISSSGGGTYSLGTTTHVISHNPDGTKSVDFSTTFSIKATLSGTYYGSTTATSSATLNTIPRGATLSAAPNFTDEQNPTITYSNPAGSIVEGLVAAIYNADGTESFAAYRDIPVNGTSYTFELTNAEREKLRNATPNSNTLDVKFYVRTTIAGTNYYSSVGKIMTIANGNPTLNPTVEDEYTASVELTGDTNKIIKGYNSIKVNSGGAAIKGASIKSQKITCGKAVINAGSGTFTDVESASFVFSITDSRGNTTTRTINKTLIDYIKLTCNQEALATVDGKITINLKGNYFNGSFGATANTLTVEYRYKESDGEYGDWIPVAANSAKSVNTYTATAVITGLDYRKAYIVQSRATDKITTISTQEKKVKAIPVFDWGENDFEFNVDVKDKDGNLMSPVSFEHGDSFGHVHYGNGLLVQWGNVVITPTAANTITALTVNFPIAFDEVPRVKIDAQTQYPNAITHSIGPSATGVTIYTTRTTSAATRFQWEARGYKAVSE